MTDQTPIDHATYALRGVGWTNDRDRAKAVFASIDTLPIADLLEALDGGDYDTIAEAIKNHLTGETP